MENEALLSEPPEEIETLLRLKGAQNTRLMPLLHFYVFTYGQHEPLYLLKEMALKKEIPLRSLIVVAKALLDFDAKRYEDFFTIKKFPGLMKKASVALNDVLTYEDFVALIEQIQQYVNVWCYWISDRIPFDKLSESYQHTT